MSVNVRQTNLTFAMQNSPSEAMPDATQGTPSDATQHATAPDVHPPYARHAADKIQAARDVLEAVQDFRYAHEHPALREAMRQTALAALDSAYADAVSAWQLHS